MDYKATPNIALEALTYLGARANGYDSQRLEERLQSKGCADLTSFRRRFAPFDSLRRRLDSEVVLPQQQLERLFGDLPGFPYNTTGAFSVASLLLFPGICGDTDDLGAVFSAASERSPHRLARDMIGSLGLSDALGDDEGDPTAVFLKSILSLTVPAESRLALLEAHQNYREILPEIEQCLRIAVEALERHREELTALCEEFSRELAETGYEAYFQATSSLRITEGTQYHLRPLLLGPDTSLSLDDPLEDGSVVVYCGVLRRFLKELVSTTEGVTARVYDAIKLLGDRTRFDILCYLRDHPAYGQELSEHFGLSRNTIYHHMNKLLNAGMVACTVEGTRVYYAIDREQVDALLAQQRYLLLGDSPTV